MKQLLPFLSASFLPVAAAVQLRIGALVPVAPPPVGHARGIDALLSFGQINGFNA